MVPCIIGNFWPSYAITSLSMSIQLHAGKWSVCYYSRSRVGIVGIVSEILVGRFGDRIPLGTGDYVLLQSTQTGGGGAPSLLCSVYRCSFPVIKRGGVELTTQLHLVPSCRMNGATPSTLPIRLYFVAKENFTFCQSLQHSR